MRGPVRSPRVLRVATRGSPLALDQARRVVDRISGSGDWSCETVVVSTTGDRLADVPIESIGGQGAFVKEVSAAVLDDRADVAVHSAKDLTPVPTPGLVLAAVPERGDPRDAMVGTALEQLPAGAAVATGSVRRRAQLAWLRPDLTFCELRGNMHRRIERAERVGAGVVAVAALVRTGMSRHVAQVLDPRSVLPQVGQGAIAVECRESDEEVIELLRAIDDGEASTEITAERAFLSRLGSGCSLPCGALARRASPTTEGRAGGSAGTAGAGPLVLDAMIASRDGHVLLRRRAAGEDPVRLGTALAAALLEDCGGRSLADWDMDAERSP